MEQIIPIRVFWTLIPPPEDVVEEEWGTAGVGGAGCGCGKRLQESRLVEMNGEGLALRNETPIRRPHPRFLREGLRSSKK